MHDLDIVARLNSSCQRPHPCLHRAHAMPANAALDVLQIANPTLHDDDVGHYSYVHLVEHIQQLDDMTPKPVIIETPEAFQLVLLLPGVPGFVPHLLDDHQCQRRAVRINVHHAVHVAELALRDALPTYLLVLAHAILPWHLGYASARQLLPYQRLRHGKFDPEAGDQ